MALNAAQSLNYAPLNDRERVRRHVSRDVPTRKTIEAKFFSCAISSDIAISADARRGRAGVRAALRVTARR